MEAPHSELQEQPSGVVVSGSALPPFDVLAHAVDNFANHRRRDFCSAVKFFPLRTDVTGAVASGVECKNLFIEPGNPSLMFRHDDGFKAAVAVSRYGQFQAACL